MIPVNMLDHGTCSITGAAENPPPLVVRARSGHALAPAPFHVVESLRPPDPARLSALSAVGSIDK